MNKRLVAFLSLLSITLYLPVIPAHSATKVGAKCTQVGIKSVVGNRTFTCIKSGKKLFWNKGLVIVKPTPTPTATPAPTYERKDWEIVYLKIYSWKQLQN